MRAQVLVLAGVVQTAFGAFPAGQSAVSVQLFEWPWNSHVSWYSSPAGYKYVQPSPAQEHINRVEWWVDYQPVAYDIYSRRGDREEYANMVTTCKAAGVEIIQDVVVNHMAAINGTPSIGPNTWERYNYPGVPYLADNFHYCNGSNGAGGIDNYTNATNVQFCELVGLPDLATEQDFVRSKIAGLLQDILSLGAIGFRVDAAKHIEDSDIGAILAKINGSYYDTQEVIYGDGEGVSPTQYYTTGDIIEFRPEKLAKLAFLGLNHTISELGMVNDTWVPSNISNVIISNHDEERNQNALNWTSANNSYYNWASLALASAYGSVTAYSGYNFTTNDDGPPSNSSNFTLPVTCYENGWRCEHRAPAIANMVTFRSAVGNSSQTNVYNDSLNHLSFSRGSLGFFAVNNEDTPWTAVFNTSMPAGNYCEIIHAANLSDCTPSVTVGSSGTANITVPAFDSVAMFANNSRS